MVTRGQILDEVVYIALIPLGKVKIQLFSLQLWVNSRADWVRQPVQKENSEFKAVKLHLKIDLVTDLTSMESLVNTRILFF